MKNLVFTFIFMTLSGSLYSQILIGFTSSQIKAYHSDSEYVLDSVTDQFGESITITTNKSETTFFHDLNGICKSQTVMPFGNAALNEFVKIYNKELITISSKKWRAYLSNGIFTVTLEYGESMPPYFIWVEHTGE
ncbi:hypothetical protein [Gillisia sp. Hel_I_29]|uniref:hypothetical protein n=1 Tax=Gillisia sp. Hel_I_29 TaxID=1249975 RepID=UPI0005565B5D|nr:hypothetical protein [Gillisia sp. Hel_I_29]